MQLTFSGTVLEKLERTAKGGKLHFKAELTATVAKAMKWGDLPEGCTGGKMEGSIDAGSISLTPKQRDLFKSAELEVEVQSVTKFEIVRLELENSKGKGFRYEIRFIAKFVADSVAAKAEVWLMTVGEGKSSMRVSGTLAEKPAPEEDEEGDED